MSEVKIEQVELSKIVLLADNVNKMDDVTFNDLVEKIVTNGFDQPIKLWWNERLEKYEVVKGNHRFQAGTYLDYKTIPAVIASYEGATFEEQRDNMLADAMSDNILKGNIDPELFTQQWQKLTKQYGVEATLKKMNITTMDQLKGLVREIRKQLPDELKKRLDESKKEIKTIEDLSRVLNEMFATYGDTLSQHFMVFSYGGKEHIWIETDAELWATVQLLVETHKESKEDLAQTLKTKLG
jgi:hypothetical protein